MVLNQPNASHANREPLIHFQQIGKVAPNAHQECVHIQREQFLASHANQKQRYKSICSILWLKHALGSMILQHVLVDLDTTKTARRLLGLFTAIRVEVGQRKIIRARKLRRIVLCVWQGPIHLLGKMRSVSPVPRGLL